MKRIILSVLMSGMLVQQVQGLFSEFATGFACSAVVQAAYAGLNYWSPNSVPNTKAAVDATYPLSGMLMLMGTVGGYSLGRNRIAPPHKIPLHCQQLEQLCYGVALGSLVGFAGCVAACYCGKL